MDHGGKKRLRKTTTNKIILYCIAHQILELGEETAQVSLFKKFKRLYCEKSYPYPLLWPPICLSTGIQCYHFFQVSFHREENVTQRSLWTQITTL